MVFKLTLFGFCSRDGVLSKSEHFPLVSDNAAYYQQLAAQDDAK
jgi:hypothetical protein